MGRSEGNVKCIVDFCSLIILGVLGAVFALLILKCMQLGGLLM